MSKRSKVEELTATRTARSKHATSFKLTDTALDILADLALKRGIAKSAVIENLLRDEHQREIEIEKQKTIKTAAIESGLLRRI